MGLSKHFMPKEKPPRRGKYDLCGSCPEENKENVGGGEECLCNFLAVCVVMLLCMRLFGWLFV